MSAINIDAERIIADTHAPAANRCTMALFPSFAVAENMYFSTAGMAPRSETRFLKN